MDVGLVNKREMVHLSYLKKSRLLGLRRLLNYHELLKGRYYFEVKHIVVDRVSFGIALYQIVFVVSPWLPSALDSSPVDVRVVGQATPRVHSLGHICEHLPLVSTVQAQDINGGDRVTKRIWQLLARATQCTQFQVQNVLARVVCYCHNAPECM